MALRFIPPMEPALVDQPPEGDGWIHEIKWDGFRTQLVIQNGGASAFTRRGHNWTDRYQPVVDEAAILPVDSAILDGEMVVLDEQGRSDFPAFADAMRTRPADLVFMAFDLLHLDGRDLRQLSTIERREELESILTEAQTSSRIRFSSHVVGDGQAVFEAADRMDLEGIVSKRATAKYRSGPARNWQKTKALADEQFVVIGTEPGDRGPPFALLAREDNLGLHYAGSAFVTLGGEERETFWNEVERLRRKRPALTMPGRPKTTWIEPRLRVHARYLKGSDKLRHARLTGIVR
jgi:bifunctional non-homologous end joining protein LigD